ncbi:glycoside hydrolase family 18 [Dysgonomonas sp. BGC7]|uniref:glycoside hydrolase family 18 n=1 Tax=Dysgonomonas sp. BGC7 TaxID=1658008 RepID=UPI0006805A8C|nr:glycoside hydrolase family 18 [Dysgonomonas sp. BGC7]MBD8387389.1 endoglycosidase [Dysgonomonas sp. BGC7]
MKIRILNISFLFIALSIFSSGCSDWTEEKSINDTDLNSTIKTDEYYAALRAWKNTPNLPQVFVWFDNWTGTSPTGENSLRGLPDSVTIASNWGGHPKFELSADRKADMEYVQRVKGTKVVVTLFSAKVGDDMPWDDIYNIGNSSDETLVRPAIRKYAEAIYDAVVASGYDGYDWDYEPQGGGESSAYLWKNKVQRTIFVEELGYWFGLGSQRTDRDGRKPAKPGLLFLVDGEIGIRGRMDKDWESQYIDYFVLQAYGGMSNSRMAGVIVDMSEHIAAGRITATEVVRRTIITENFESYANTGGGFLNMSRYIYKAQYEGEEIDQQIGGCGLYRSGFDYIPKGKGDYDGSPEYYFLRQGITNIYRTFYERQNPAPESEQP